MAECVFAATQTRPGTVVRSSPHPDYAEYLSSGAAVDGIEISVCDEAGQPVPDGEPGQIFLKGSFLFDGYFREPERTAGCLSNGWYASGDLGFLDRGELFVVGRTDDVLNINGRKLLAHEVEDALAGVDGVMPGRIFVYADHDRTAGATRLCVAAERGPPLARDDAIILADLRRSVVAACGLAPYDVSLVARGSLIKSTSGKLSRKASLERLRAGGGATTQGP